MLDVRIGDDPVAGLDQAVDPEQAQARGDGGAERVGQAEQGIAERAGFLAKPETPEMSAFLALVLNNLAYLGTLGLLIVLLAGPGTRGPNRFGPPPA